jgi:hypothetical protein
MPLPHHRDAVHSRTFAMLRECGAHWTARVKHQDLRRFYRRWRLHRTSEFLLPRASRHNKLALTDMAFRLRVNQPTDQPPLSRDWSRGVAGMVLPLLIFDLVRIFFHHVVRIPRFYPQTNRGLLAIRLPPDLTSRMVMKFLSDLDILSPSMWRWPVCRK